MIIQRPHYMNRLVAGMGSDRVKVITGMRRCGKSFLLFNLFKSHLLETGTPRENIIEMAFDRFGNRRFRDPDVFYPYLTDLLNGKSGRKYVLLDEVQLLDEFSEVLIDLIGMDDVDVYVTGSNAHLLSKDVVTEFRGRGLEIRMLPLSFSEFMTAFDGDKRDGYVEYATYGGLPGVLGQPAPEEREAYLKDLYHELYLRDIIERNGIRDAGNLDELVDVLSSSIGSLTNPTRLAATFRSEKRSNISAETIERYISCLEDAFLINRAKRFDIKGRRYIGTPFKYYFSDLGIRNARMNFRQMEESHIMENVIYNELIGRGYSVDVGVVPTSVRNARGASQRAQLEVDFICNKGSKRYYVQSALSLPTEQKWEQEQRSLLKIEDGFKKIIITRDGLAPHYNDVGILVMNVYDFLLDSRSLEF